MKSPDAQFNAAWGLHGGFGVEAFLDLFFLVGLGFWWQAFASLEMLPVARFLKCGVALLYV
jgi:hypothetical protein